MSSAIADAGPFLHLHEIGRLNCLKVFERILIPDLVAKELNDLQLGLSQSKISTTITIVAETDWHAIITEVGKPVIHPADAQVFSLARTRQFQETVLTDDLALRRHLKKQEQPLLER